MHFNNERKQILIFSGTTEGNQLAEKLSGFPVDIYLSVATEYGKVCAGNYDNMKVLCGRMDEQEIKNHIKNLKIDIVVDATHPFARIVTENIKEACEKTETEYIRCLRESFQDNLSQDACKYVCVDNIGQAVEYLKGTSGNILTTTGSKELRAYTEISDYKDRCFARVLSSKVALEDTIALGFEGKHLIAMQGPFSTEMNIALIRHVNAAYFVTKESGKSGGFEEKIKAAEQTGTKLIIIRRPEESGLSTDEVIEKLTKEVVFI